MAYGDDMKYIMIKVYAGEEPILFPATMTHSIMARDLGSEAVSAGFVTPGLKCYGESTSLKIKSRPEDTEILRLRFGLDSDSEIKVIR